MKKKNETLEKVKTEKAEIVPWMIWTFILVFASFVIAFYNKDETRTIFLVIGSLESFGLGFFGGILNTLKKWHKSLEEETPPEIKKSVSNEKHEFPDEGEDENFLGADIGNGIF